MTEDSAYMRGSAILRVRRVTACRAKLTRWLAGCWDGDRTVEWEACTSLSSCRRSRAFAGDSSCLQHVSTYEYRRLLTQLCIALLLAQGSSLLHSMLPIIGHSTCYVHAAMCSISGMQPNAGPPIAMVKHVWTEVLTRDHRTPAQCVSRG